MNCPENIRNKIWKIIFIFISLSHIAQGSDPIIRCFNDTTGPYEVFNLDNITELISYCSDFTNISCFASGFSQQADDADVLSAVNALRETGDRCVCQLKYDDQANSYLNHILPRRNSNIGINYPAVVYLSTKVSEFISEAFCALYDAGLDLGRVHWIGHSLGAEIFGIAGRKLKTCTGGVGVARLSALDPAGPAFQSPFIAVGRVGTDSAVYVDVHHTDPALFGNKDCLGHVDVWYNLAEYRARYNHQPGCTRFPSPFSSKAYCSHVLSVSAFKVSTADATALLACNADNQTQTYIGDNIDQSYRGSLYVCTSVQANSDGTVDVIDAPQCCTDSSASQDPSCPY